MERIRVEKSILNTLMERVRVEKSISNTLTVIVHTNRTCTPTKTGYDKLDKILATMDVSGCWRDGSMVKSPCSYR